MWCFYFFQNYLPHLFPKFELAPFLFLLFISLFLSFKSSLISSYFFHFFLLVFIRPVSFSFYILHICIPFYLDKFTFTFLFLFSIYFLFYSLLHLSFLFFTYSLFSCYYLIHFLIPLLFTIFFHFLIFLLNFLSFISPFFIHSLLFSLSDCISSI